MRDHWKPVVACHNTTEFDNLGRHFPGVKFFADRALVLPVRMAVVQRGLDPAYLDWLKSPGVRLGPKKVVEVDGPNLFDGLDADPDAMKTVEQELRHGGRFQPFVMTSRTQMFLRRHGISRVEWHGAPLEISREVNDKAKIRSIVEAIGYKHMLLPYAATQNPESVRKLVREYLAKFDRLVVKRTNLAGGDGMLFIRKGDAYEASLEAYLEEFRSNRIHVIALRKSADGGRTKVGETLAADRTAAIRAVESYLERAPEDVAEVEVSRQEVLGTASMTFSRSPHLRTLVDSYLTRHQDNKFIVEQAVEHDAYSNQVAIGAEKSFDLIGTTRQLVDGLGHHLGNATTRFPHPARISREDLNAMKDASLVIARWAHDQINGYDGILGFDYLKEKGAESGKGIYLMECNGRQTASTYLFGVLQQIESRITEPTIAREDDAQRQNTGILMLNAARTRARSFDELKAIIGSDLIFEGLSGVVPINIRLMNLPEPHCGFIAVAPTIEKAEAMSAEVQKRMSA